MLQVQMIPLAGGTAWLMSQQSYRPAGQEDFILVPEVERTYPSSHCKCNTLLQRTKDEVSRMMCPWVHIFTPEQREGLGDMEGLEA